MAYSKEEQLEENGHDDQAGSGDFGDDLNPKRWVTIRLSCSDPFSYCDADMAQPRAEE